MLYFISKYFLDIFSQAGTECGLEAVMRRKKVAGNGSRDAVTGRLRIGFPDNQTTMGVLSIA